MARSRSRRLRRIAQQTAALRAAPERRELNMALGEAVSSRDQGIQAARATGRGLRSAIRQARPEFRGVYGAAGRRLEANRGLVNANMPGASSGPASAILAAAAAEQQAAENANVTARRETMADLTQQRVRASEGTAFAVRNARDQYQQDVGKILQQLLGLSQEEGAFAAAEFGRLRENALDRDVTKAGQRETRRHNRAVEGETGRHNRVSERNAAAKAGQRKIASQEAHVKANTLIGEALAQIKLLDDGKGSSGQRRAEIGQLLLTGTPNQTDQETGETIPGVPKIPRPFLRAALDQHFNGHLTRPVQKLLYRNGYVIRRLDGVTSYREWRRKAMDPWGAGHDKR